MEIDGEKILKDAILTGVRECVSKKLMDYNSPLNVLISSSVEKHSTEIRTLLEDSIQSCITDPVFRSDIAAATRQNLAKLLVQRFGGELEKQVNVLKSDPTTRARIVLAIEEIVKSKG